MKGEKGEEEEEEVEEEEGGEERAAPQEEQNAKWVESIWGSVTEIYQVLLAKTYREKMDPTETTVKLYSPYREANLV